MKSKEKVAHTNCLEEIMREYENTRSRTGTTESREDVQVEKQHEKKKTMSQQQGTRKKNAHMRRNESQAASFNRQK